jgi:hypothetical protein
MAKKTTDTAPAPEAKPTKRATTRAAAAPRKRKSAPTPKPEGKADDAPELPAAGETDLPESDDDFIPSSELGGALNDAIDQVNALDEPGEIQPFKRTLTLEERQERYAARRGSRAPRGSSKPKQ